MDNVTLKEILETIAEFEQGKLEMSEKIFKYQQALRESKVVGELENGNIYILRFSLDGHLYAVHNMNIGPLVYISTYDEYMDAKERENDPYGL
jgi:hypothetical protein